MIEELIKQKAKEYLGLSDTLESYYGLNKQEVIMTAFADGAEAMREIANTWIRLKDERPPETGYYFVRWRSIRDNANMLHDVGLYSLRDARWLGAIQYEEWKPITL